MITKIVLVTGKTCILVIKPRAPFLFRTCFFFKICMDPDFVVARDQAAFSLPLPTNIPVSTSIRNTLT